MVGVWNTPCTYGDNCAAQRFLAASLNHPLMGRPSVLVVDEPSLGLSPCTTQTVFGAFKAVHAEGMTVVLVKQNVGLSLRLADRAYVLENGQVVRKGSGAPSTVRIMAASGQWVPVAISPVIHGSVADSLARSPFFVRVLNCAMRAPPPLFRELLRHTTEVRSTTDSASSASSRCKDPRASL